MIRLGITYINLIISTGSQVNVLTSNQIIEISGKVGGKLGMKQTNIILEYF